ncbi:hypothetical protein CHUAL_000695 [Chamberlinius hualienensis]
MSVEYTGFENDEEVLYRAEVVRITEDDVGEETEKQSEYNKLWCTQETICELIKTEETYLKRLVVLQEHFSDNLKLMLSNRDWKQIFQHVKTMLDTSHRFLEDLLAEKRKSRGSYIPVIDFCRVVRRHAECNFDSYVVYCSNQIYQQRSLNQLKTSYPVVEMHIKHLETTGRGMESNRSLESYLVLPVQRITLLPLLIDSIAKNLDPTTEEHESCTKVTDKLRQIATLCNERAREIEMREEMLILGNQLEFNGISTIGLVTEKRFLVKKGQLKKLQLQIGSRLSYSENHSGTIRTKSWLKSVWLFLFNDLIIVARKRKKVAEDRYKVLTHCQRNFAVIFDSSDKIQEILPEDFNLKGFQLCLLQNHRNATEELILFVNDCATKQSWVDVLGSKSKLHLTYPKVYQEWDCPQMKTVIAFIPEKAEELLLDVGDVVDVLEKRSDGWCYGVKVGQEKRSGGWFLRSHVEKVPSVYERAKIVRRNYQTARRRRLEENSYKRTTFYTN